MASSDSGNHDAGSVADQAASVRQQAGGGGVVSTTVHTPGPWEVDEPFATITAIRNGSPCRLADVLYRRIPFPGHPLDRAEAMANARLIAAGPTMYAYIAGRAADGDVEAFRILESIHATRV